MPRIHFAFRWYAAPTPEPPPQAELDARLAAAGYAVVRRPTLAVRVGSHVSEVQGYTDREQKLIAVATHRRVRARRRGWLRHGPLLVPRSDEEQRAILHHELEHAEGRQYATNYPQWDLYCGGDRPEAVAEPPAR